MSKNTKYIDEMSEVEMIDELGFTLKEAMKIASDEGLLKLLDKANCLTEAIYHSAEAALLD